MILTADITAKQNQHLSASGSGSLVNYRVIKQNKFNSDPVSIFNLYKIINFQSIRQTISSKYELIVKIRFTNH